MRGEDRGSRIEGRGAGHAFAACHVRWPIALALGSALLFLAAVPGRAGEPVPDPPEPPVRLKKKEKPPEPPASDKKPEPAKPPQPREPQPKEPGDDKENDPEAEAAEILARVSKNMRNAEDRLAKKDAGAGTRQVQREILKDLDSLINQTRRQQQQQQQANQRQEQDSSENKDQMRQKSAKGQQRKNQPALTQKPAPGSQPKQQQANRPGSGGKSKQEAMSKIADLYKEVWGHLPETLRQEMDQYSREQFMAKYNDLLKQYYATIAEKGHRKGE